MFGARQDWLSPVLVAGPATGSMSMVSKAPRQPVRSDWIMAWDSLSSSRRRLGRLVSTSKKERPSASLP
ncbi:hypothetical protein D3C77_778790 [compost metagenome]